MASNLAQRNLRKLMLAMMILDFALTLAGQPSGYWKDPSQAQEFNALAASAMRKGPVAILAGWSIYTAAAFALTFLPRSFGLIAAVTFGLAHFCAASGWIVYRFHLGMAGLYLFSFLVAAVVIFAISARTPKRANQAPSDPGRANARSASDDGVAHL